jgi:uncharacterized protein
MQQVGYQQPPIESITRRIVDAFRPRRVIMFGSRARTDARADNDVDLMTEMETDLSPPRRAMAIDELFGLCDWSMDLIVYTPQEVQEQGRFRNSLLRVIEAEGKVLYERPG